MAEKEYNISVDPVPENRFGSPYQPPTEPYGAEHQPLAENQYGVENKPVDESELRLRRMLIRDMNFERRLRVLKLMSRILTLILSAIVLGTLLYTLVIYLRTRNHPVPGLPTLHPWSTPTKLWPTIMVITISAITLIISVSVLISYARSPSSNTADKIEMYGSYFEYVLMAATLVAWIIATCLYNAASQGNNPNDLYGYSCGNRATQIQAQLEAEGQSFLNFGQLCTVQTYGYSIQITTDIGYAITFLTYCLVFWRWYNSRKMRRHPSFAIVSESFNPYAKNADSAFGGQGSRKRHIIEYQKGDGPFYCILALIICAIVGLVIGLYFRARAQQ